MEYWYLYFIVIYLCIILPALNRNTARRIKKNKMRLILISHKSVTVKSPQNRCAMGFAAILQTLFNGK